MSACTINGRQCTACCRAITLRQSRKKLKRMWGRDADFILANWKPLSRRRAKKKNPYLVNQYKGNTGYWHCRRITDAGCSVYDERPRVCRDYPLYGNSRERLAKQYSDQGIGPEYHPECTEWPRIPATNT